MRGFQLPYQPMRPGLYTPDELLSGFDPLDPESFAETRDFQIFQSFVTDGRAATENFFAGMMQSLHDNSITQALRVLLAGRRCVAIMGAHQLHRDDPLYEQIAVLSRDFTRTGLLVASGGGPGAMEATHLGAALAGEPDVLCYRWLADYPDPDSFATGLLHSRTGLLAGMLGDPALDRLCERGRRELDPALRHATYRELEEVLAREALIVPLLHEQSYRFCHPSIECPRVYFALPEIRYEEIRVRR